MLSKLRRRTTAPFVVSAAALLAAIGCGASNSAGGLSNDGNESPTENGGTGSGSSSSGGSGGSGDFVGADGGLIISKLPPEMPMENKFKAPVATGNFVWTANPTSGRVAYINASTFEVKTTAAGNGPTFLAAVADVAHPGDDVAIVLNVLSQDATLLRVNAQGTLTTQTYPSTVDGNSWAVSPSGHWAIAWTDATFVSNPDPTQGFQSVAVMDLSATVPNPVYPAPSTVLAVGYRPSEVAFAGDTRAYAVTQDGISVIDLTGPEPLVIRQDPLAAATLPPGNGGPPIGEAGLDNDASTGDAGDDGGGDGGASTSDAGTASGTPEVSFTPDGSYALVRRDGLASITIDSLADGTLTTIPLPSPPTDLTVSQAGDFAVAVLRDTSTVAVLPLPGIVSNPSGVTTIPVPGQVIGRALITGGGKSVVLFTTVAPIDSITVLTLSPTRSIRTIPLHAPVQAVFPTSDGQYAVVLHQLSASTGSAQGAFSVVPIGQNLPAVIESLQAPPTAVALTTDRAIVSVSDNSTTFGVYLALMPSLEVLQYSLASPPIAVGIAAGAGRGYAAQDYDEGRITFVDLGEGDASGGGGDNTARTITGFELSAGIVVGPDQ
jgi:hypothetical protein